MHARLDNETTRLVTQLRADLAADPTNSAALYNLVKLEVIPAMERDLAAEHAKPRPDRAAIAALTEEIQSIHSARVIPDHIRQQLLASVTEPVSEPQA
jgi:hypothetical protein